MFGIIPLCYLVVAALAAQLSLVEEEEEEEEADSGGRAKVCGNKKRRKRSPPSFPILLHTRNSNGELLLFFLPHQRTLFFSFPFACLQFCSWKYTGKGGMWMWGLLFPPPPPPPPFHSTHVSGRKSGGLGRSGPGPTFSERGKVSCSIRRRNLDNLFYKVQ